ncbi:aspartic peptidase domain-containing protein [Lasiosphaeris hirsuta]|uniref:Aspartic peptidase domain-containing protein n=1 Tax=Lasiosphaeris hirsuta TaxID=260670 RepID=A0AA40E566_9PEZI|nr:aspartic peptidase domain-containing protein [Lasiosphaeris hirsuta]
MSNLVILLLLLTTCASPALIPPGPRRQPLARNPEIRPGWQPDPRELDSPRTPAAKRPGYVRLPVSRHVFNGTGKWQWGWHWSPPPGFPSGPGQWGGPGRPGMPGPPGSGSTATQQSKQSILSATAVSQPSIRPRAEADRRWGWSYLEELGGIAYILQLDIGTPPQKVKVFIDTGSYELWVNPRCNTSASESLCQSYGNYFPNKSNSSSFVGGDFAVTYGTGAVKGSYWSDIMSISMFQIPQVQFAVANDSNYTFSGILGLGYSYPYSINYPSVLNLMVSQNLISAPIFSVGLGGDTDGFSEIIFGGVNRWKFAGPLEPVPIWPPISSQDPHWIQYWINVTSVGITKPGQKAVIYTNRDTFNMPTLIDTGSTLSYIREDLVAQIGQQFAATIDAAGNYIVDCEYRNKSGTVDFGFNRGRMVINVRYKDFIYQQYAGHCMLGVQPADVGSTNYVLGDTFIRGAYLVFDQQSDVIWMNQYYNCGDAVVTVGQTVRDTQYIVGAC